MNTRVGGFRYVARALALATVSAGALSATQAMAQDAPAEIQDGEAADTAQERPEDILVVGIRGSISSAADKKRNAKQIVDSVVSEDVGKLPDNNVPEALSRVTGVQIDRARGQGQGITIRGLSEIQTTINGNQTNLGADRSMNLADIPAELLKSVDVYKTRSADQVEGGIAGTVNIELRRPLDLKKGLTLAGSIRGVYDDIAEKVSPYASILVGNRFETGIGEIGFLVNASWTKTNYLETYIESESPSIPCCEGDPNSPFASLPANLRNVVIPYRAYYGTESGYSERPSINIVGQWRANDNLDFVLEGGYLGSRERRTIDRMYVQAREFGSTLSNIVLGEDGRTIRSLTESNPNGVPAGFESMLNAFDNDLYTSNFEMHWRSERAQINASAQYNWSDSNDYNVQQILRLRNQTSVNVDFDSDEYPRGVPKIDFGATDLSNIANYGVDRFQDRIGKSHNKELSGQVDLTLKLSDASLLRSLQVGTRYNKRDTSRYYGYRDGLPRIGGQMAPLSTFPGADQAALVSATIGDAGASWYRVPGSVLLDNIDSIRAYIQANDPGNAARFASEIPLGDLGQTWDSVENVFAAYAQVNYAFDVGFPVDGLFGVRYTNTWGNIESYDFRPGDITTDFQDIVRRSFGKGNYVDVLPTATAILHFTPKTQLRLSYSTNVQRPSFYDTRPFAFVETRANPVVVYAGNPDLKAQDEQSFNASLEHYFGRGGLVTLAGYYKKATGFLYYSREEESLIPYGQTGVGLVEQQRNAGNGTFAGIEVAAQSFFDFLPGFWRNFGASVNASYVAKARVEYPYPEDFPGAFDSPNTSKWTANAALYYDTPTFSARVAYNYRSSYRMGIWVETPEYSPYQASTQRLDAAINVTPYKFLTLSLEGGNLLGSDVYRYHGQQELLPLGVRTLGRTVQASARFRF
ncbi:TonB-dependent receptor [Sphingomonas psychrotolerans]|uniref:TonB-dependent receptor n=1 Tax=Sphingomonas psychrotolerans TaxID=1327635 RepID=A0A2K8MIK3_9SPHN|nr:TonB-dependent receptor [Sphingomonas psychrotolerans]ATY31579.1 TonB-dependent receptor [Sphingomonas psychrotolerans]